MNGAENRRQRIVRIRLVEHRIAQQMLAKAQREAAQIQSIRDRITALNRATEVGAGESYGVALAAIAETRSQLAVALRSTTVPLYQAVLQVSHRQATRTHAEMKEKSARRVLEKTESERHAHMERRASASRCYRVKVDTRDEQ